MLIGSRGLSSSLNLLRPFPPAIRSQHAAPSRELAKLREGAGAGEVVASRFDVDVEQILPRSPSNRPALELAQVDVAQGEHTEGLEQRAWRAGERKHESRLVGVRRLSAADHEEP